MMPNKISITSGSCLGILSSQEVLIDHLKPFIQEVATGIEQFGQLKEAVLKAAQRHKLAATYFYIDPETIEDSFSLDNNYLFPHSNPSKYLQFINRSSRKNNSMKLEDEALLPKIHKLLCCCSSQKFSEAQIRSDLEKSLNKLFDALLEQGIVDKQQPEKLCFASLGTPGVFRLQHASLLYRTKTTGILVDPHLHSTYELSVNQLDTNIQRSALEGKVDAILISHSHGDHWNLATLMMFPPETPIIVPKVPRASILCEDMQQRLHSLGFENVIAVDWYSEPLIIGDIEISVLPFYGEQPLRYEQAKHPDLRSWGNTYLLRTEYYTSWFLIDSGNDAMGTMAEVAAYVQKKFGPVDLLLSNLREFSFFTPFYITGGSYWLSLSAEQMRTFNSRRKHCLTLGSKGVAQIAQIVGARYYLPYAHWWACLGENGDVLELDLLYKLQQAMKDLSCPTVIVPWTIGDGYVLPGAKQFELASILDNL